MVMLLVVVVVELCSVVECDSNEAAGQGAVRIVGHTQCRAGQVRGARAGWREGRRQEGGRKEAAARTKERKRDVQQCAQRLSLCAHATLLTACPFAAQSTR